MTARLGVQVLGAALLIALAVSFVGVGAIEEALITGGLGGWWAIRTTRRLNRRPPISRAGTLQAISVTVPVPNLVGLGVATAHNAALDAGVLAVVAGETPPPATAAGPATVACQRPAPGHHLGPSAQVRIWLQHPPAAGPHTGPDTGPDDDGPDDDGGGGNDRPQHPRPLLPAGAK